MPIALFFRVLDADLPLRGRDNPLTPAVATWLAKNTEGPTLILSPWLCFRPGAGGAICLN